MRSNQIPVQRLHMKERKILMSGKAAFLRILSYTLKRLKQMLHACQNFSCEKPEGERLLLFHGIRTIPPCL